MQEHNPFFYLPLNNTTTPITIKIPIIKKLTGINPIATTNKNDKKVVTKDIVVSFVIKNTPIDKIKIITIPINLLLLPSFKLKLGKKLLNKSFKKSFSIYS